MAEGGEQRLERVGQEKPGLPEDERPAAEDFCVVIDAAEFARVQVLRGLPRLRA